MKSAVIVFPGSNCDRDMAVALAKVTGNQPEMVWHGETELPEDLDVIAIPGGFSYGDYLRCGAMASRTQIINPILAAAKKGVRILGVCNGFQVLTEIGLLPGALMRNSQINFICKDVPLRVENSVSNFASNYAPNALIALPVAHHDGNYFANDDVLDKLEGEGRVAFRYINDINGSQRNIAGITNQEGNVLGMMPHPERAVDSCHGGTDGLDLFRSLLT
jgi:phosphoribosylformylglycinamidine synthase subunit PurQ / glutaminase